jgi:hypothetical protein
VVVSAVLPVKPEGHGAAWGWLLAEQKQIRQWVTKGLTVVKIGVLLERRGVVARLQLGEKSREAILASPDGFADRAEATSRRHGPQDAGRHWSREMRRGPARPDGSGRGCGARRVRWGRFVGGVPRSVVPRSH